MPTLNDGEPEVEPEFGHLATHYGGKSPVSEQLRRAELRRKMFGDPGDVVTVGRYVVTGHIGSGAMGTVFRAHDPSLDREVAVKVLHRSDEVYRARMTVEAKALAKLSHPNVVTVHEVGTEDDQLFVAMEFVQGKTLTEWLAQPSELSLLNVFAQAAQGLQAAHDAGIVHRDFKPDNVIVGDDGRVRVLDFGMARTPGVPLMQEVDGGSEALRISEPAITRTGLLAGTPGYMAPEQFDGARVDARADQFAFCIALHEAVWGERPFRGKTVAELARDVLAGQPRLFEGVPVPRLEPGQVELIKAVIQRGLQTDPARRFESMQAIDHRLRSPLSPTSSATQRPWRNVAFGVTMLLGVGTGVALLPESQGHPAAVEPEATVKVHLSSRCNETTRYTFGPLSGPSRFGPIYSLSPNERIEIETSASRYFWMLNPNGMRGPGGRAGKSGEEIIVGPDCKSMSIAPVSAGGERAIQLPDLPDERRKEMPSGCGLGTELRDGDCHPIDWDPSLVHCDDGCTVHRDALASAPEQAPLALRQVRFVPSMRDGTRIGFKVYGVRQDTVAGMVGLKNGDLITAVNDIDASASTVELVPRLRDLARHGRTLSLEFTREGAAQTKEIRIRE